MGWVARKDVGVKGQIGRGWVAWRRFFPGCRAGGWGVARSGVARLAQAGAFAGVGVGTGHQEGRPANQGSHDCSWEVLIAAFCHFLPPLDLGRNSSGRSLWGTVWRRWLLHTLPYTDVSKNEV